MDDARRGSGCNDSIDPPYSKGIHTIITTSLGMKSLSIGLSRGIEHYNLGRADE